MSDFHWNVIANVVGGFLFVLALYVIEKLRGRPFRLPGSG